MTAMRREPAGSGRMSRLARRVIDRRAASAASAALACADNSAGGDAPIGIVEQSKLLFQSQDAAHGGVYVLQFDEPARESFWQAADIDAAHHVDVDARPQRERRRFDEIRRDAMLQSIRRWRCSR